jgi:hypothetical protein
MVHYLHQLKLQKQRCFAVDCWLESGRSPAAAGALFAARYPAHREGNPSAEAVRLCLCAESEWMWWAVGTAGAQQAQHIGGKCCTCLFNNNWITWLSMYSC